MTLPTGLRPSQIQLLLFFADETHKTPPPPIRLGNYRALADRGLLAYGERGYDITDAGRRAAEDLAATADPER